MKKLVFFIISTILIILLALMIAREEFTLMAPLILTGGLIIYYFILFSKKIIEKRRDKKINKRRVQLYRAESLHQLRVINLNRIVGILIEKKIFQYATEEIKEYLRLHKKIEVITKSNPAFEKDFDLQIFFLKSKEENISKLYESIILPPMASVLDLCEVEKVLKKEFLEAMKEL